jgi:hypothetical protein
MSEDMHKAGSADEKHSCVGSGEAVIAEVKRRGRPPKSKTVSTVKDVEERDTEADVAKKKPGRPRKQPSAEQVAGGGVIEHHEDDHKHCSDSDTGAAEPKKKQGRAPKDKVSKATVSNEEVDALAETLEQISIEDNRYFGHPIPGMSYRRGLGGGTIQKPFNTRPDGTSMWYDNPKAYYPPEFTAKTVRMFPIAVIDEHKKSVIRWGNPLVEYTLEMWNAKLREWDELYPNLKDKTTGSTPHETEAFRGQQTRKPEIMMACWEKLSVVVPSRYTGFARELMENFRVDRYGNVVCLPDSLSAGRANNSSLTFFDVDHIFPWCRGGRSGKENFEAVQNVANRAIKSDNMVQSLNPVDMNCGITLEQLISMVDLVLENYSQERLTTRSWLEKILSWLTTSPVNKASFTDFQKEVGHTTDGRRLIQYFVQRESSQTQAFRGLDSPPKAQAAEGKVHAHEPQAKGDCSAKLIHDPEKATLQAKFNKHVVEVFGPATISVKDELKKAGYIWDGSAGRKCWTKRIDSDEDAIRERKNLTELVEEFGMQLKLS